MYAPPDVAPFTGDAEVSLPLPFCFSETLSFSLRPFFDFFFFPDDAVSPEAVCEEPDASFLENDEAFRAFEVELLSLALREKISSISCAGMANK